MREWASLWSVHFGLPEGLERVQGSMVPGWLFLNQDMQLKVSELGGLAEALIGVFSKRKNTRENHPESTLI